MQKQGKRDLLRHLCIVSHNRCIMHGRDGQSLKQDGVWRVTSARESVVSAEQDAQVTKRYGIMLEAYG